MDINLTIGREDYRRWAEAQPNGRFERVDGRVVRMPAEQIVHVELKMAIWRALADAVRSAGLKAQAFGDGVTVEVGADTDYEPDALVNLGPRPGPREHAAPWPVIVVEVLSPSTQSIDTGDKLAGYFCVPSIMQYLVVSTRRRQVVQHRRVRDTIVSSVATAGAISLDPPGISLSIDTIYQDSGL